MQNEGKLSWGNPEYTRNEGRPGLGYPEGTSNEVGLGLRFPVDTKVDGLYCSWQMNNGNS